MAEVLSIASGIAGLISLTIEVYGISYKYINGVRNANSSARRFLEELKNSETVLLHIEELSKAEDQVELFGDTDSCLLSIEKSNDYIDLLNKVRNKLQQRQTGSSIRDGIKSLTWPFSEKETSALADALHRHLETYNTALAVDNRTIGKLTLNEVRQLNASQEDSMIQEVLDWLSPLNMYQKQQDTLSRRHGTTGSWLLNDSAFRDWIDSDDSQRTLWCPGDPGTGKTVITSIIINYLINNYAGEDTKIVYLYCDYKDQAMQTASNLIACLARQIIGYPKVLPQQLEEIHKEHEHQKRRPSFNKLMKLLIALCKQYNRVYIIVDALDECEAIRERRLLLPVLEVLSRNSGRLFVTSRPNNEDISNTFGKQSRITIAASELDLRQYVAERIAEEERRTSVTRFTPELKKSIISNVSAGASGMFLLAALQMDRVFAARTVKGIKSAIASMPQKIDDLYNMTLERIQQQAGDDGMLALRILSWITHARRPLSVSELRYGLAVEYDDDEDNDLSATELDNYNLLHPESLVDVCAGLVIIDSTSQIIRLVHYTTQEYFSNKRLDLFAGAEADISRACLTYLSYDIGYGFPNRKIAMWAFKSYPFLLYASGHWFSHVHKSLSAENPAPMFLDLVARFKCSASSSRSISLLRWVPGLNLVSDASFFIPDLECPDRERALETASYWGLEELVAVLLDHKTGSCPGLDISLFFASQSGAIKVVNLLLRYGAQVNVPVDVEKSRSGLSIREANTALSTACKKGHLLVAKVLIENGANIYDGNLPPMYAAALANEPIMVDFLLKEGINVNARDSRKQTALHYAASYNSVGVFKLLLDAHCDLDLQDKDGRTAIQLAVSSSRVGMVKKLLDAHCDSDRKDDRGETALHYAARNGSVEMVRLLLDAHCDLKLKDYDGRTALHTAVYSQAFDVIELLLERGADPSTRDKSGETSRNILKATLSRNIHGPGRYLILPGGLRHNIAKRERIERLLQRMSLKSSESSRNHIRPNSG